MIRLSVIVPTRNRRDVLMTRALPAMFNQQMRADEFEIVVVVDGSTDGTAAALRELRPPCSLIVIEQPGCGAGAARNTGIQAARGDLLLFLDDDIVCESDLFLRHIEAHHGVEPVLVYGVLSIHPETPPSVMKYGTQSWYRDYYSGLQARCGLRLPEDNFLISNSSVPRATVIECGLFDERMTAKEDYELGLRLWKKGVQFKFLPQARASEFFLKSLRSVVCNDGKAFGETEILLSRKHPEYRPYSRFAALASTTWSKSVVRRILAGFPVNPTSVLNLPLWACDKLCRFPVMRRAGCYLMGIGRSVVEIRTAVREAGSWRALEEEFGSRLPVLLYHHVGPDHPETVRGLTVSPQKFERQIRWLAQRGFQGICPGDWLQWLRTGNGLPAKPILLTFDDAYADIAEYALPILRKHGFSGAVFVVTGQLGGTNTWDEAQGCGTLSLMTAEQIRYWDGQGIEFGAHSRSHAHLTKLSAAELSAEVVGSKIDLSALLDHLIVSFAYPYGDYNDAVRDLVRDEFDLAFNVEEGLNYLSGDRHLLKRAYIGPTDLIVDLALSVRLGGIRRIRDWRSKVALRTRLKRLLGISRRHAG
jgi:peptidoglycan/xylan/chitin deacetylase (PgdA/CDA1 family)/glycosyltransferase involved in cell wall biosynthesis